MHDFLLHIAVGGVSFLIGAGLTRLWDRARPLVILQGFAVNFGKEVTDCPDELVELTDQSWHTSELYKGKNSLSTLRSVYDRAKEVTESYDGLLERLPLLIAKLQAAEGQNDILSALRDLIQDEDIRIALDSVSLR